MSNSDTTETEVPQDQFKWNCSTTLRKFEGDSTEEEDLIEEVTLDGNSLMYGGSSNLWQCLIGNGSGTAGQALTYFNNANAAIGVGDSTTANALTMNDLQGTTNKVRVAMDSTYPQHSDGLTSSNNVITFRSTFSTSAGNFAWQEWGIFNSPTAATGRMLNRAVTSLGTKTSSATWQLTVTLTLS